MAPDTASSWLAWHVFHHGDHDALLLDCVRPLISSLRDSASIHGWFFVRYWNGGPHVRLRIKPVGGPARIREATGQALRDFLRQHPAGSALSAQDYGPRAEARRAAGSLAGHDEVVEDLQPADTVDERAYLYEAARYGHWRAARAAIERHFGFSSDLALFVLGQTKNHADARLTIALHLTAVTARVLAEAPEAARDILRTAGRSIEQLFPQGGTDDADIFQRRGFPDCAGLKTEVAEIVSRAFHHRIADDEITGMVRLSDAWRTDLATTLDALTASAPEGEDRSRWRLVGLDCMHMLNNRLGVSVDQECFAYRLVAEALNDMAGQP